MTCLGRKFFLVGECSSISRYFSRLFFADIFFVVVYNAKILQRSYATLLINVDRSPFLCRTIHREACLRIFVPTASVDHATLHELVAFAKTV